MGRSTTVDGTELQWLLSRAADETLGETDRWVAEQSNAEEGAPNGGAAHQEALAWLAASLMQDAWDLLPQAEFDDLAPIAYAIHEVIEWVSLRRRAELAVQTACWSPLTWSPSEESPGGRPSWIVSAVEQRSELLRHELADFGITVILERQRGVA